MTTRYYPFAELEKVIQEQLAPLPGARSRDRLGVNSYFTPAMRGAYYRYRALGHISTYQADKFAIAMGMHPFEIWENWFDPEDD